MLRTKVSADQLSSYQQRVTATRNEEIPRYLLHGSGGPVLEREKSNQESVRIFNIYGDSVILDKQRLNSINNLITVIDDVFLIPRNRQELLLLQKEGKTTKTLTINTPFTDKNHEMKIFEACKEWRDRHKNEEESTKEVRTNMIRQIADKNALKEGLLQLHYSSDIQQVSEMIVIDTESEAWISPEIVVKMAKTIIRVMIIPPKKTRDVVLSSVEIDVRREDQEEFESYSLSAEEETQIKISNLRETFSFAIKKRNFKRVDWDENTQIEIRARFLFQLRGLYEKYSDYTNVMKKVDVAEIKKPPRKKVSKKSRTDFSHRSSEVFDSSLDDEFHMQTSGNANVASEPFVYAQNASDPFVYAQDDLEFNAKEPPHVIKSYSEPDEQRNSNAVENSEQSKRDSEVNQGISESSVFSLSIADPNVFSSQPQSPTVHTERKKRAYDFNEEVNEDNSKRIRESVDTPEVIVIKDESVEEDDASLSLENNEKMWQFHFATLPTHGNSLEMLEKSRVEFWLLHDCRNLQRYAQKLFEQGYDSLERLVTIEKDELVEMEIPMGHVKAIMKQVKMLKEESENHETKTCILTNKKLKDPRCGEDGYIYEYDAIRKWIEYKQCSPCTGLCMQENMLKKVSLIDGKWAFT